MGLSLADFNMSSSFNVVDIAFNSQEVSIGSIVILGLTALKSEYAQMGIDGKYKSLLSAFFVQYLRLIDSVDTFNEMIKITDMNPIFIGNSKIGDFGISMYDQFPILTLKHVDLPEDSLTINLTNGDLI